MKLKFLILNCSFLILTACGAQKPVTSSHIERIETQLKPVAVGADTIELEISSTVNSGQSTVETSKASKNDYALCIMHYELLKSTRPISLQTTRTDSSTRIKLTLAPDTVFVPYTTHIRSDTIVVPDPVTQQKLKTANWKIMLLTIVLIAMLMLAARRAKLV